MRLKYNEELVKLNDELISMGEMCSDAITFALHSLTQCSDDLKAHIVELENEINQKERSIEQQCMRLLLRQQPVASDLRMISSALKMISDMERIGDQAFDISYLVPLNLKEDEVCQKELISMGKTAIQMVKDSVTSFVNRDLELAYKVMEADDIVDKGFVTIKNELIDAIVKDKNMGEEYLNALMIAKYFERIGDHGTNIAEWVEYAITGKHKRLTPKV